jgi:uncharacterized protein (TIGR00251 family)
VIQLTIRVVPRASKPGIAGIRDGALLVRLQSPPVEGAANEELIQVIAKAFGVAKRDVAIVTGDHSKLKRVAIETRNRRQVELTLQSFGINPQNVTMSSS